MIVDTGAASHLRPLIIIGAGRSGTKMVRDLLVAHPHFATWPCDEINYIWRHGNRGFESDEFTREMADDVTKGYIRGQFRRFQQRHVGRTIVEKTCANSLRCGFVHEVFPLAKFIHIVRDGRDVAASAALRWNAPLDLPYLARKARYVPLSDLPFYAASYLNARLFRTFSGKSRLSTWGPRFAEMDSVFASHNLAVGCALQWQACVRSALDQLELVPDNQVLTINYEHFAAHASEGLRQLFQFAGVTTDGLNLEELAARVSRQSVGNWKSQLSDQDLEQIETQVGPLLHQLGYVE